MRRQRQYFLHAPLFLHFSARCLPIYNEFAAIPVARNHEVSTLLHPPLLNMEMTGIMDNFDRTPPQEDEIPVSPDPQGAASGAEAAPDKVREMDRDSLFMQGVLYLPGQGQPVTVRVRNLSAGGLMADYAGDIAKDSAVEIELRNLGRIAGRVAWVSPSQFGLAFDTLIDPLAVRRPIGVKRDDLFRPVVVDRYLKRPL